jgi:hypothetical protein
VHDVSKNNMNGFTDCRTYRSCIKYPVLVDSVDRKIFSFFECLMQVFVYLCYLLSEIVG